MLTLSWPEAGRACRALIASSTANAQFVAWEQCTFNGGTKLCTFPEKSKWKFSYGPFILPGSSAPSFCYDIRFESLSADTPNEIYDKVAGLYTQSRIDACLIDLSLPYTRAEDCNAKPESLGFFNSTTSYYADEHPLYNQAIIELPNCSMPLYNYDSTVAVPTRPPWRELVCKYGTPALSPSGAPFCLGNAPPVELEELGEALCDRKAGNPIDLATGNKYQREVDYERGARSLLLARHYNSKVTAQGSFGRNWSTDYDARLSVVAGTTTAVAAMRGDGSVVAFKSAGSAFVPDNTNARYSLVAQRDLGGVITGWLLRDKHAATLETYNASGRLLSITSHDNYVRTVTYNASGWLAAVTDSFGRTLTFVYGASDDPAGIKDSRSVEKITDPAGNPITYRYDAFSAKSPSALTEVTYQDTHKRSYLYELLNPTDPNGGTRTDRLLGIVDERNNRLSTYLYDADGKAVSTEHALGTRSASVTRTETAGSGVSAVSTIDGIASTRQYDSIDGRLRLVSQSQPAGSGCSASTRSTVHDNHGNPTQIDDFNGERSCHVYDLSRNQRTVSVRGLNTSASCAAVVLANAALPTGALKTTTQWHPDWDLATEVASPGRITSYVYNGQPDPSSGGAIASCAPAGALLPDGKPIAVLCKVVEKATTNANGSAGFAATLDPSVVQRVTSYTYNADGQVLTRRDPRNAVTSFNYYASAGASNKKGDLLSIVQPNNTVQTFNSYNPHGDALQMTNANGLVTNLTYDTRGRVTQAWVGGEITSMVYDPAGLVTKITTPRGYEVNLTYDAAQRLVGMADKDGNTVAYTLDIAGNRTEESYKDAAGTLERFIERSYDGLNRLFRVKGAAE